jgi:hypothetical protein
MGEVAAEGVGLGAQGDVVLVQLDAPLRHLQLPAHPKECVEIRVCSAY